MPGILLEEDLLVAEIGDASATILFIRPHAQQTLFAGLEKRLAVHDALLSPTIRVWLNLLDKESPRCIAEHLVFFFKYVSVHRLLAFEHRCAFFKKSSDTLNVVFCTKQRVLQFGFQIVGTRPVMVRRVTHDFLGGGN